MKWIGILAAFTSLLAASAVAKPVASRQVLMTNGVSAVFDASSKQDTIYGYVLPITITKADAGKILEIVAESPRPITIELWDKEVLRTETEWFRKHQFLGSSGKTPSTTPSFKWMAEPGTVSALFLSTAPPGAKPDRFFVYVGKELRTPTAQDKAEWTKAVAERDALLARIESERRAIFPPFTARDTAGRVFSTQQYRGKIVLIDFWAAWCPPCRTEMPNVVAAYQKYQPAGFEVIGVSLDKDPQSMTDFLTEMGATWPQVYDGKGWDADLAKKYKVESIPASYLLDGTGRIIARDLRGSALEKAVARAVASLAAPTPAAVPVGDKSTE